MSEEDNKDIFLIFHFLRLIQNGDGWQIWQKRNLQEN